MKYCYRLHLVITSGKQTSKVIKTDYKLSFCVYKINMLKDGFYFFFSLMGVLSRLDVLVLIALCVIICKLVLGRIYKTAFSQNALVCRPACAYVFKLMHGRQRK